MTAVADLPLHKGLWQPSDVRLVSTASVGAQRGGWWWWRWRWETCVWWNRTWAAHAVPAAERLRHAVPASPRLPDLFSGRQPPPRPSVLWPIATLEALNQPSTDPLQTTRCFDGTDLCERVSAQEQMQQIAEEFPGSRLSRLFKASTTATIYSQSAHFREWKKKKTVTFFIRNHKNSLTLWKLPFNSSRLATHTRQRSSPQWFKSVAL